MLTTKRVLLTRLLLDIEINKILWLDPLLGHIGAVETTAGLVGQAPMDDVASASVKPDRSREVVSKVLDREPLRLFIFLRHFPLLGFFAFANTLKITATLALLSRYYLVSHSL